MTDSPKVCYRLSDGTLIDLNAAVPEGAESVRMDEEDGRHVLRHSCAHVLAQAVLRLFGEAKYAIGPPVEVPPGYYYDFDVDRPFTPQDLEAIESEMRKIVEADQSFVREEVEIGKAAEIFSEQPYKLEIIEGIGEDTYYQGVAGDSVSLYRNDGGFVDLCRGPHLPSTGMIPAFKLLRTSGAYWRGDEARPMLQRIYGTAWESPEALEDYLHRAEEAERRDHRRLGRDLDLYSFPGELGVGLALWHPRGAVLRRELIRYAEDLHDRRGYQLVSTPHIAKAHLWETSGHLAKYAELMYPEMTTVEGDRYYVKPMNCPFHVFIYKSALRSYRELPIRLFELGTVYRQERSGVVHGMLRARGFTQDDSHIFCTEDQLVDELLGVMDFVLEEYSPFGFTEAEIHLSTFPGVAIGTPEMWEKATEALRNALLKSGREYKVAEGEGAFYGPKIDFHFRDAIGRLWQLTTVQCDFALPEQFELEYVTPDGSKARPVMIHRAIYGAVERFVGVLVEHYGGAFPTWLAPVQARVIPIAERHAEYAGTIMDALRSRGIRAEVASADETLGNRIRRGQVEKVPYMLVVGDREAEAQTVSMRARTGAETKGVTLDAAAGLISDEVNRKGAPEDAG